MFRTLFSIAAAVAVALVPRPAHAQPRAGTVAGVVRDATGAAIPGVTVRIVNEQSGAAVEAVSTELGQFQAVVPPGHYRLEMALDGFEPVVQRIEIEIDRTATVDVTLNAARVSEGVVVTARRIEEVAQEVPIPLSVVGGDVVDEAGAFNMNRLKERIPTVQFYSTNPRNSAINIRGLGAPFGLTNDGIEPGVGL